MSWVKIDDQFPSHPKVQRAGLEARALYITALCYSANHLTDGFVTQEVTPLLTAMSQISNGDVAVKRLVEVGLWEVCEGGYMIHDYLIYNPNGDKIRAKRTANANRQARFRDKSNAESNGVTNAVSNSTPVPVPVPHRSSKDDAGAEKVEKSTLLIKDISEDLQSSLDKAYQSLGRKTPIYFKSAQQRDAYIDALKKLNGQSKQLIDKGISRERTSLSALLAWLETCVKNLNGHARQGSNNGTHQGHIEESYTDEELARAERINARRAAKAAGLS